MRFFWFVPGWTSIGSALVLALPSCSSSGNASSSIIPCNVDVDCTGHDNNASCEKGRCVDEDGHPVLVPRESASSSGGTAANGGAVAGGTGAVGNAGATAGTASKGGAPIGGASGTGGSPAAGSGGTPTAGTGGAAAGGSAGTLQCPPCAAPPSPDCVGSGPCGCGPYTCPDGGAGGSPSTATCGGTVCGVGTSCCGPARCGSCIGDLSGAFCPNWCEYCNGSYNRFEPADSTICSDGRALWELMTGDLMPFFVEECEDMATGLPRYCCAASFEPVCP